VLSTGGAESRSLGVGINKEYLKISTSPAVQTEGWQVWGCRIGSCFPMNAGIPQLRESSIVPRLDRSKMALQFPHMGRCCLLDTLQDVTTPDYLEVFPDRDANHSVRFICYKHIIEAWYLVLSYVSRSMERAFSIWTVDLASKEFNKQVSNPLRSDSSISFGA
jgi:hypothetical protein